VKVQWLWDVRYIDAPVLRWRDENDDGDFADAGETLYYCNDANMNVTALVSASSGAVLERVVYDPYGKPKFYDGSWANPSDTSAYANEILYCGYRWNPESGVYDVRRRPYHPTLGRLPQRDPAGHGDGMNPYQYCRSGPLVFVDPLGLSVPGTLSKDELTVHKTTAEWAALGSKVNGATGYTEVFGLADVTGTYDPASPCCCTFTINKMDLGIHIDIAGVGVGYDRAYGVTRTSVDANQFTVANMHEGFHRADSIAIWEKYRDQLTPSRTCCYTRGLWIFERGYTQSAELCSWRAGLLKTYLEGQLGKHIKEVGNVLDAGVGPFASGKETEQAHAAATAHMAAMTMRDWDCDDTHGWFW
jgi:RHS repeat-associated protein